MVKCPAAPQTTLDGLGSAESAESTLQARPWWGPSDGRRVWSASWPDQALIPKNGPP